MQNPLPAKSVKIEISGNSYDVNFPNTGEFIDIQVLKSKITEEQYKTIAVDAYGALAMVLVDMIATFNILIPDLKQNINTSSILGLSLIESKLLLDAYNKQWMPFFNSWIDVLYPKTEDKKPENI